MMRENVPPVTAEESILAILLEAGDAAKEHLRKLRKSIAKNQCELVELQGKIPERNQELERLQLNNSCTKEEVMIANEHIKKLKETIKERETTALELKSELAHLREENFRKRNEIQKLKEEGTSEDGEIARLTVENNELRQMKTNWEVGIGKSKEQLAKLKTQKNKLETQKSTLETAANTLSESEENNNPHTQPEAASLLIVAPPTEAAAVKHSNKTELEEEKQGSRHSTSGKKKKKAAAIKEVELAEEKQPPSIAWSLSNRALGKFLVGMICLLVSNQWDKLCFSIPPNKSNDLPSPLDAEDMPDSAILSINAVDLSRDQAALHTYRLPANLRESTDGRTLPLLHTAALREESNTIKALLAAGTDVNLLDEYGETALYYAVDSEAIDCVKVLLEAGSEVDKPTVNIRVIPPY
ncbi:MAG: ankyrin repeat and box protein 13-like [Gammaproteobacteria bacterium]|jgi:hypothetical protein|nr:ankyrin repeat and box protein 13-like [Gammaproteobacteria bacterium]